MKLPFYTSKLLEGIPYLNHGFFTRNGGVSEGHYESLSCKERNLNPSSPSDPWDNVVENRRRIVCALKGKEWVSVNQKHGANVVFVDKPFLGPEPEVDAIITQTPGLVISILTADCTPILLADRKKQIVAAVHAGWGGAFSGVIENAVEHVRQKGAGDIVAAIGPTITQAFYEMGPEFHDRFHAHPISQTHTFENFFKPSSKEGHFLFDLPKLVYVLLQKEGIQTIDNLGLDTYSTPEIFFSYRRSTHEGHRLFGNQSSSIVIL